MVVEEAMLAARLQSEVWNWRKILKIMIGARDEEVGQKTFTCELQDFQALWLPLKITAKILLNTAKAN